MPTWFNIFISGLDGDRVHLQQICRGDCLRGKVMTVRLCQASSLGEKHCCTSRPPGPTRSKATRVSATGTRKQHVHTYTHTSSHMRQRRQTHSAQAEEDLAKRLGGLQDCCLKRQPQSQGKKTFRRSARKRKEQQ